MRPGYLGSEILVDVVDPCTPNDRSFKRVNPENLAMSWLEGAGLKRIERPMVWWIVEEKKWSTHLCFGGTSTAGLELAAFALVDEWKGTRVTQVAVPRNERCIRLDDLERVLATRRLGHGERVEVGSSAVGETVN